MAEDPAGPTGETGAPGSRSPWRRRAAVAVYVLLGLVAAIEVGRDLASPGDYTGFVAFGTAAAAGQIPYAPAVEASYLHARWATWPPSFAPIAVLLARLDGVAHEPAVFLFQLVNLLALGLVLAILTRWLYGRRLTLGLPDAGGGASGDSEPGHRAGGTDRKVGGADPWAAARAGAGIPLAALPVLGALLVPLRLVLSNFEHAQCDLIILGLAIAGMWLLHRGRRIGGGAALGLATAFKATPLILLGYLAWRRRWRDLAWTLVGCAVTWLALPAILLGPGRLGAWYGAWIRKSAGSAAQTSPLNQSLLAALERLAPGAPGWPLYVAVATALVAVGLWAIGRREGAAGRTAGGRGAGGGAGGRAEPGAPAERPLADRREVLEVAMVLAAMNLLSPLAWKSHFVTLVPLCAALFAWTPAGERWRAGVRWRSGERWRASVTGSSAASGRGLYVALGAAFVLLDLSSDGLLGRGAAMALESASVITWGALLLAGAGLVILARRPRVT